MTTPAPLSVQQMAEWLSSPQPPILLDVREPAEVATVHVPHPNFINIPLGQLPARLSELNPAQPLAVICRSGGRSAKAVELLTQHGFTAHNVTGGTHAWVTQLHPKLPLP